MPPNTVYVGRPTRWGNKFLTYEEYDILVPELEKEWIRESLKGKNLACWCPLDQPCHADILLEIANER